MQKFLERHNLLKVTQEEIDNLNNLASIKGMEFILKKKKPSTKILQAYIVSLVNSTKHLIKK